MTCTDEQREKYISDLALLVEGAMGRWEATGCFHARGQAVGYRLHMERIINGRSAAQVARMETNLGLAA